MRILRLPLVLGVLGWIVAAILATLFVAFIPLQPHIGVGDTVNISVLGTLPDQPVAGDRTIMDSGAVSLGPTYGTVHVATLTTEEAQDAINTHLQTILTAPETSVVLVKSASGIALRDALPKLGWVAALILIVLLALTTVRAYTVPEPRRRGVQFGMGVLLCLMVIVALATVVFMERRERLRIEADRHAPAQNP